MKRVISITMEGRYESDLDDTMDVIVTQIQQGFTSGQNSNEDGSYSFTAKTED